MRKHRKTRLLTMDELHARPCEVDGRPALFHRWVEETRVIINVEALMKPQDQDRVLRDFYTYNILPPSCTPTAVCETFALVEYRDGTIHKVKPELIRFTGKEVRS